jgi:ribosomal protein L37AE/L43A
VVTIKAFAELGEGRSRAGATGLRQCNKAWVCPTCAKAQQARDAETLHAANIGFRADDDHHEVYMVTITVPHNAGQELRDLRTGITRAYQTSHTGAPELRRRERFGVLSTVRRLEVTAGPNGWHPHIHALVFCRDKLTDEQKNSLIEWYFVRVGDRLEKLGYGRPSKSCIVITRADKQGRYLAKMGLLELAGDFAKKARCARCGDFVFTRREGDVTVCRECGHEVNRTPWQILHDWHLYHQKRDRELWQTYTRQIAGARRLTWSRWRGGLNLRKVYDKEDLKDPPPKVAPHVPLEIPRKAWRGLSEHKRLAVIEAYEDGNLQECFGILGEYAPTADPFSADDPKPDTEDRSRLTMEERTELAWAGFRTHKNRILAGCGPG